MTSLVEFTSGRRGAARLFSALSLFIFHEVIAFHCVMFAPIYRSYTVEMLGKVADRFLCFELTLGARLQRVSKLGSEGSTSVPGAT